MSHSKAGDWEKAQELSGGQTARLMVGSMEESRLIQSSGLAGGRGQAGVTCSHWHGIKCPLTGSRCCPAVHPQFRPALLRGLCSGPHQLRPQISFWVSVSSSAAQARIKMEELARKRRGAGAVPRGPAYCWVKPWLLSWTLARPSFLF